MGNLSSLNKYYRLPLQDTSPLIRQGLVDSFPLTEASGNRTSLFGRTVTDTNTVGSTAGKIGTAANFVAANSEKLYGPSLTGFEVGDADFSFSVWLNPTSFPAWSTFVSATKGPQSAANTSWMLSQFNTTGRPNFVMTNGSSYFDCTWSSALSTATWYFIYCYFDSWRRRMGISVNAAAPTELAFTGTANNAGAGLTFGSWNGPGYYANAAMQLFRFHNRVLLPEHVAWFYNSGNGRSDAEILAT